MTACYCKYRVDKVLGFETSVGQWRYLLKGWAAFAQEPEKYRNLTDLIKEYMKAAGMLAA